MNSVNWKIRVADHQDIPILLEFNQSMARETEGKQLATDTLNRGVKAVLDKPDLGFYLVATHGDQIAGSLMITTEWSDWRAKQFWWIQSVFVAPRFRRQGVYRALFSEVKQRAQAQSEVCGIRLYVEKNNTSAQQTYRALGMYESHYLFYETDSPG